MLLSCSANNGVQRGNSGGALNQEGFSDCQHYYDSLLKIPIYTEVTSSPEFPGGNSELYAFIKGKLKITSEEFKQSNGKVVVEFVVDTKGKTVNARIFNKETGSYSTLDNKIIGIIKAMPEWKPGKCNDDVVAYLYRLPIVF